MEKVFLSWLICITGVLSLNAQSTNMRYITFKEASNPTPQQLTNIIIPSKEQRVSSERGIINLTFDENVPDSIRIALSAARDAWEYKINASEAIYITALMDNLGNDYIVQTDVLYTEDENRVCPAALDRQIRKGQIFDENSYYDAYIILNSSKSWNCSFSDENIAGYNVYTFGLRSLATALGFGATICEENKKYLYTYFWPSFFESNIHCGNTYMCSLTAGSKEFCDFITSENIFVNGKDSEYELYSSNPFFPYKSLSYLVDGNSLMYYDVGNGGKSMKIDNATIDILNGIGWNVPKQEYSIICDNIGDNGIGSSYESHTFSLDAQSNRISSWHWSFYLKDKTEKYTLISQSDNVSLAINKISNPTDYFINLNGDLVGRIECIYTIDGVTYNAVPFNLSLELKPIILSIDTDRQNFYNEYSFALNLDIKYSGADYLTIEVEEEYNTTLRSYRVNEPYIAHAKTGKITSIYGSWVTIIVKNKYGSVSETLEFYPDYYINSSSDISFSYADSSENCVEIFNPYGHLVFSGTAKEYENIKLNPGLYVMAVGNKLENNKIIKIAVK